MAPLIQRAAWSSLAERALRCALGGFEAEFRRQVTAGHARLWCVNAGEAWIITRTEIVAGHAPELVVCAMAGSRLHEIAPAIIEGARLSGCATIRFHTVRRGLARMCQRYGFRHMESVYQLDLREVGHG